MPQISVEYSAELADSFDRGAFALALHPVVADVADSPVGAFKTRFHRLDECVIGDGGPGQAMVHVRIALLSGRSAETKKEVSDAAAAVLANHLTPVPGTTVQATVEIGDLDRASYRKQIIGPA